MVEREDYVEVINTVTDVVKSLPEEVTKGALTPPATEIGKGLSNLVYFVFSPLLKARVKIEHQVEKMKKELNESISDIPDDKLVEPPLNIVGPALEGSKYYIENDDIRSFFVNLISSAANSDKADKVHPSYVEIIKQMSPQDATCLKFLVDERNTGCGILHLQYGENIGGYREIKYLFPIPGINTSNMDSYLSSVDNLIRLGIIECGSREFRDSTRYETMRVLDNIVEIYDKAMKVSSPDGNVTLKNGSWNFTKLGGHFVTSCIPSQ
ncbi:DUF4393 domain-containing protein [Paenibacillus sp. CC-CFT742]|nr:DUF4393 domain-containing protein [Paenibacillus sp. CC-CFT742]WJH30480.1 DUF4393 domain-containing protein [Paenibacillus sp. CC-CFT742]